MALDVFALLALLALPPLAPLSLAMLAPLSHSSPKRGCTNPPATGGGAVFLAHASASSPNRKEAAGTGALEALLGRGLKTPSPRS